MDRKQLEMNVNLHSLQPNFLNSELHYIIAKDETTFRFSKWNEKPAAYETKFYCYLTEQPLFIPAGNISLEESYVLNTEPVYPVISDCHDFIDAIEKVKKDGVSKSIRQFSDKDIADFKTDLEKKYGTVEKHLVQSGQGQHLLLIFDSSEVSISQSMVYFRHKAPFSDSHYQHVKEE